MIKFSYLKIALEALNHKWNFTLNTDGGYESVRSRDKILKSHYIHNSIGGHRPTPEFYEALEAYLSLRRMVDEIENEKMVNVAIRVVKWEPKISDIVHQEKRGGGNK